MDTTHKEQPMQGPIRDHIHIAGSDNIVGDHNTCIEHHYHNVAAALPSYEPPAWPAPDALSEPGALPPGSRIPFSRNALFTGRENQLLTLARIFAPEPSNQLPATRFQAIQGMGGVGKTQLAVEFAYRYGRFFHGVHWINALQPSLLDAEVAACGLAMGLTPWPDTLPEQLVLTLQAWATGGPRLIILDNLEDPAPARAWLAQLSQTPCRVLITARRAEWPRHLGLSPLRVDCFTPEESRAFLSQYLPAPDRRGAGGAGQGDLDALHTRLGGLPLALELAGRYLAACPRLSIPAYLQQLNDTLAHPSMQRWRAAEGNATSHDLDLAATFAVSWARVEDAAARELFALAGWCAPNTPIPCELLERAAGLEPEACDLALSDLRALGLLEEGNTIHPLLAEFARGVDDGRRTTDDGEETTDNRPPPMVRVARLADALAGLAMQANDLMDETGSLAHFAPLRSHIEALIPAAEDATPEDAANLSGNLGYYLNRIADLAGARAAHARALRILEQVLGEEHPTVATAVNNLGSVLQALGDLAEARAAYERALRIDEAAYGPEHPDVATDVNNLGSVLQDLGDLAGARAALERALRIDEAVYGQGVEDAQHPNVAIHVNNLGSVLQALGDLVGAQAAFERALRIDEAVYGPEHPNVARDVNNLGSVLQALGDLAGTRAAYARALRIWEASLGEEHPNVASATNNLGSVLQALGDLAGARAAYARALAIREKIYGRNHPETAISIWWLGIIERDSDNLEQARAYLEETLRIFERFLPPEHPDICTVRENLESLDE